jgi:uncharacterized membrane protein YcaP (DUF421 family)
MTNSSVTDGLLPVATIMTLDYLLDWISSRFHPLRGLIHPKPLLLVRDGRLPRANMPRELVSDEELWIDGQHGVRDLVFRRQEDEQPMRGSRGRARV